MTNEIKEICQSLMPRSYNNLNNKSITAILKTGTDELIKKLHRTVSKIEMIMSFVNIVNIIFFSELFIRALYQTKYKSK